MVDVKSDFNRQLNQELRNAYLYLSMGAYFESISLPGFAHYFRVQAREEVEHAMKLLRFMADRGWRIELEEVPKPRVEWGSVLEAVEDFVKAEEENTRRIWGMVDLARQAGDKAAESFLQWFVNEQVEEERNANDLAARVRLVGEQPAGLLMLDRMLSERK